MTARKRSLRRAAGTGSIPEIVIDSWQAFHDIVAGPAYRNWAFRGQADKTWPLNSSISRHLKDFGIHRDNWAGQEARILRIFQRKAHLHLEHVPDLDDAFQWLALMQHHGAPTRLLDFTWSPFVAAFFALERAKLDAAVWGVFPHAIFRGVASIDFPGRASALEHSDIELRNRNAYRDFYLGNTVPFVTYGEPHVMNKRLVAQSGTFVVPGVLDQPVEKILSKYPRPAETAVKFVLKTEKLRDEAMVALYTMNLTNATLFPDLNGLASSMAFELEYSWSFNTKRKRVIP